MLDTHCHLASRQFAHSDISALIAQAKANGVTSAITIATGPDDWQANLDLAARFPDFLHTALGFHPCDADAFSPDSLARLESLLARPEVVAIGESGLDYFHPAPDPFSESAWRQLQQDSLSAQINLALRTGLPMVIHTRDKSGDTSFRDAIQLLAPHAGNLRAVFHCFIGSLDQARQLLDLGFLVSFTGIASFPKSSDLRDVVKALPPGSFMLETDSPYLAPVPHRGKTNHPALTLHTAEAIAAARGESLAELDAHTTATARAFFRLP